MPPLDSKIEAVMQGFEALCAKRSKPALPLQVKEPIAVAWTGGKDSTVVLHLWKSYLELCGRIDFMHLVAINIDTGLKFPEIIAFRDMLAREWGVMLHVARPQVSLQGYPVARDPASCCAELKIAPLRSVLQNQGFEALLTGLRRDEHPERAGRKWLEQRENPKHLQCNPILEWSEMDVWSYIMDKGLGFCELYAQGYRSLGCMPCTAAPGQETGQGERGGRNQSKEAQLEQLRSLGYF